MTKTTNKMSTEEINKRNDEQKRARAKIQKNKADSIEKALNLAAEKIACKILKNNPLKDMEKELVRKCIEIPLTQIIDRLLEKKKCPMLTKTDEEWDCLKSGCHKGEETYCKSIDFLNCPAINNYFNHEMIMKPLRKRNQAKRREKEKEAKRKAK